VPIKKLLTDAVRSARQHGAARGLSTSLPPLPEFDPLADQKTSPAGYLITMEASPATAALAAPLALFSRVMLVTASQQPQPGQHYLIGFPGEASCEVVEVVAGEAAVQGELAAPGPACAIRRRAARTLEPSSGYHPAGTRLTAVTVEYVADWEQVPAHDCPG
jgi:hypothetical protein